MSEKKINNKEIVLRQWFAARYGNSFEDHANWDLPKGIAEMNREYTRDNPNLSISFNFFMYKVREIEHEVRRTGKFELYEDVIATEYITNSNSYQKFEPGSPAAPAGQHVFAAPVDVVLNIRKLDDMEYPTFRDFPTGTTFDRICSDDDALVGLMSGMVIICTGESGVGKSTLLIDVLSKIKNEADDKSIEEEVDHSVHPLYISSEMTKTDLYFFKKKMPAIGKVDAVLIADYMKQGLKEALTKAFRSDKHDVILLDSYQDTVEKMQDILNWRAKEVENFLIQLMVEAAEQMGKCIIAIQHLTKGGEYVGRTFLKHTTTAMLEVRFDKEGGRFAHFVKNRRAGSMTHVPMYFTIKDGEVAFDEDKFTMLMQSNAISSSAKDRQEQLTRSFGEVFAHANRVAQDADRDDDGKDSFDLEPD